MLRFISENWATVIAAAVIAVLVILALRKIIKNKKDGVGSCGYKCSECPRAGACGLRDEYNKD